MTRTLQGRHGGVLVTVAEALVTEREPSSTSNSLPKMSDFPSCYLTPHPQLPGYTDPGGLVMLPTQWALCEPSQDTCYVFSHASLTLCTTVGRDVLPVTVHHGAQAVSNEQYCTLGEPVLEGCLHLYLRPWVHGGSRLIQDEDLGFPEKGTCQAQELLLTHAVNKLHG